MYGTGPTLHCRRFDLFFSTMKFSFLPGTVFGMARTCLLSLIRTSSSGQVTCSLRTWAGCNLPYWPPAPPEPVTKLGERTPVAAAMYSVQQNILKKEQHPYYWAGFYLAGRAN